MAFVEIKTENNFEEQNSGFECNFLIENMNASVSNLNDYKSQIVRGIITLKEKRGRSKVWNLFAAMHDEHGDEIEGLVACRSCLKVFKHHTCTTNLVRHKCFINFESKDNASKKIHDVEVDKETKDKFSYVATQWIISNCRPLSILEDTGLKDLARIFLSIGLKYGDTVNLDTLLPDSEAIESNVADLYGIRYQEILAEISKIKSTGYSITVFVWTDNMLKRSFVAVTLHYVMQAALVNNLLSVSSLDVDLNSVNCIVEKVASCLKEFDCDLVTDDPLIVTTNLDNFAEAFKGHHHVHCTNNLLRDTIQQIFKNVPDLQKLLKRCIKLVENFRSSAENFNLCSSTSSENTILYYLKTVQDNWQDVSEVLLEKDENPVQLADIEAIVHILVTIEKTSKTLVDENMPTLHIIIPHLHKLRKLCDIDDSKITNAALFKRELKSHLDLIKKDHITKYHKIALFLFPPTKKLLPFDELERKNTIEECKSLMQRYYVENEGPPRKRARLCNEFCDDNIFSDFMETQSSDTKLDAINNEINEYLIRKVTLSDFNVLDWWRANKDIFPLLYKVSCKILSTPASVAPSERAILQAMNVINSKTDTDNMINDQIFLSYNRKFKE